MQSATGEEPRANTFEAEAKSSLHFSLCTLHLTSCVVPGPGSNGRPFRNSGFTSRASHSSATGALNETSHEGLPTLRHCTDNTTQSGHLGGEIKRAPFYWRPGGIYD